MKMVVVEVRGNTAVALRDDGSFVRLGRGEYWTGQTIEKNSALKSIRRFPRMAAACIAAVLVLSQAALAVCLPYSYVTLDVNPSIQYTLNIFDRVLSVSAVNQDADTAVAGLEKEELSFRKIGDAIHQTIARFRSEGYVSREEQDYIVLSVASQSEDKAKKLSDQLACVSTTEDLISAEVVPTTIREIKEARREGTTPGKLALIGKMQKKTGDTQSAQAWIHRPVREIMLTMAGERAKSQGSSTSRNAPETGRKSAAVPRPSGGSAPAPGQGTAGSSTGNSSDRAGESASGRRPASAEPPRRSLPARREDCERGKTAESAPPSADGGAAAISSLSQEDRETLKPHISAHEDALAAERSAAANENGSRDLPQYRQAAQAALTALRQAAGAGGITFETTPGELSPGAPERSGESARTSIGSAQVPGAASQPAEGFSES